MTIIVILAVFGILLILAELVLPGGIMGIAGFVCLAAAVAMTFVSYGPSAGALALVLLLIFGFIVLGLWMKNFHRLPFTSKLVLRRSIDDRSKEAQLRELIGQQGITLTPIAPSGHAEINGEKIDVMSESGPIKKGASIRVVDTRGPSVFVEEGV